MKGIPIKANLRGSGGMGEFSKINETYATCFEMLESVPITSKGGKEAMKFGENVRSLSGIRKVLCCVR